MVRSQDEVSAAYDFDRAGRFYSRLRARVAGWLRRKAKVSDRASGHLLLLPDLFALLVRLIKDPRIDAATKVELVAVSAYVIAPVDIVPDILLPLGLVDDAVAIAFALSRVVAMMDQAGEDLLREHWEGEGDVLILIQRVLSSADDVLSGRAMRRLRERFARPGGEGAR